LDFYYPAAKLAIELDGGGHSYRLGQIRDRKRSELFARGGSRCAAVLESLSSLSARQCPESHLVCAGAAVFVETLTLILSLAKGRGEFLALE
jgi:hypothetical protein